MFTDAKGNCVKRLKKNYLNEIKMIFFPLLHRELSKMTHTYVTARSFRNFRNACIGGLKGVEANLVAFFLAGWIRAFNVINRAAELRGQSPAAVAVH